MTCGACRPRSRLTWFRCLRYCGRGWRPPARWLLARRFGRMLSRRSRRWHLRRDSPTRALTRYTGAKRRAPASVSVDGPRRVSLGARSSRGHAPQLRRRALRWIAIAWRHRVAAAERSTNGRDPCALGDPAPVIRAHAKPTAEDRRDLSSPSCDGWQSRTGGDPERVAIRCAPGRPRPSRPAVCEVRGRLGSSRRTVGGARNRALP